MSGGGGDLVACLLSQGAVSPALLSSSRAPDLGYAAVVAVGSGAESPTWLLHELLAAAPTALAFTRDRGLLLGTAPRGASPVFCTPRLCESGGACAAARLDWQRDDSDSADGFSLLSVALSNDKAATRHRAVQDVLFEDSRAERTARAYRRLGGVIAAALAQAGEDERAAAVLRAARRISDAPAVDADVAPRLHAHVAGRSLRLADKALLDSTLAALAAAEVLAAAVRAHGNATRASAGGLSAYAAARRTPNRAQLLASQDAIGRSAFHIAAWTDNAYALRGVLRPHALAALVAAAPGDAGWQAVAASAVFLRDGSGRSARELALLAGNVAAAAALAELEGAIRAAAPGVMEPPPHTREPASAPAPAFAPASAPALAPSPDTAPPRRSAADADPSGGWCAPLYVGAKAAAAVASGLRLQERECDVDVVDYTDCTAEGEEAGSCGITPAAFARDYLLAARPILLRGYARRYAAFSAW